MKKLITVIMLLSLVMLCGCKNAANGDSNATNPNTTDPSNQTAGTETTVGSGEATDPIEWETPIDVDDSYLEDQPEATDPAASTEPNATDPNATDPAPTDPSPTNPAPTEPAPTNSSGSKPIELPMIPG